VSILNKGLASISPSEKTAIRKQWVELDTSRFWEKPVYKYTALAVLGLSLLFVVAVIIWNRMLNARVRQRTQELKNAQMQLIQAEKMESIGRLAAGVAHEVKNPLAIIQMGADYLSQEMPADETTSEVINDIDDAVRRADMVVKGLLDFSRDKELGLKQGNINQVIEISLHLVDHEMRQRNIEVILDLAENVPDIDLDANKLQQVLINLFMNSAHAMERKGKLFVASCLKTLDSRSDLARDHENRFNPGDTVLWVEIEDTGTGIKEEDKVKIFDPFYTTKPVGEGTGLGLSVSKNIINLHEGAIDIRNRKEGGASVVIMFKLKAGDNE
jgi:signal transduction histidine kinase